IMLVAIAAFLTGFGFLAIPPVARDLVQLNGQTPALPDLIRKLSKLPVINQLIGDELVEKAQAWDDQAAGYVLLAVKEWAAKAASVITGIVLTVYFILEGDAAYFWFLSFIPLSHRERLNTTLQRSGKRMGRWLLGQASLMLILGLCSTAV